MPLTAFAELIVAFIAGILVGALIYNQYGQEDEIIKLKKRMEKLEEKNAETT